MKRGITLIGGELANHWLLFPFLCSAYALEALTRY